MEIVDKSPEENPRIMQSISGLYVINKKGFSLFSIAVIAFIIKEELKERAPSMSIEC